MDTSWGIIFSLKGEKGGWGEGGMKEEGRGGERGQSTN